MRGSVEKIGLIHYVIENINDLNINKSVVRCIRFEAIRNEAIRKNGNQSSEVKSFENKTAKCNNNK